MTDYISRADALVAVCKWCEHPYCKSKEECGQWIAMTILPSADAVEVDRTSEWVAVRREEYEDLIANAVSGYTKWLEKIIVDNEGANEWLCEDTTDMEWCEKNCHYSSIQAECLRHLYEVRKGGDTE